MASSRSLYTFILPQFITSPWERALLAEQLPPCRSCHPVALGIPIRRNHRKCDAIPARNDLCSAYLIPKSRHVSSTSLEIAG